MAKYIDLHIHSNFSEDADFPVEEIFKQAQNSSISVISITDHDSVQSIDKAGNITKNYSLKYVPGVELTTVFPYDNSQQHILGYFIDHNNQDLLFHLVKIAEYRKKIALERIDKLKELNFSLDESRIFKMTGDRPPTVVSIISELFSNINNSKDERLSIYLKGVKADRKIANFYKDYFSEGGAAYVPFKSISTQEGIEIIKKSGGVPILAHPVLLKNEYLDVVKEMGIAGIEAVSTYHKPDDTAYYLSYASQNGLLVTAGSDFHGPTAKPHIRLGEQKGMAYLYFEKLALYNLQNNAPETKRL